MPMVEDLSQFLAVTEFAHQAVLDNVEVSGIFDNTPTTADTMTAQVPTYLMASSACARVVYGSRLRIPALGNAGHFTVEAIEPDGTGMTLLRLQQARAT